jgi:hypothetical protein
VIVMRLREREQVSTLAPVVGSDEEGEGDEVAAGIVSDDADSAAETPSSS